MSGDVRLLLSLYLPFFAIHCAEQIYFIYGNVLQSYGLTSVSIGWILGIFFMTVMAIRPLGGWVLENFGLRRTLVWSSFASFIGCSALLVTDYEPMLFAGRALSGAGFSVYTMGLFSHQAIVVPEEKRGAIFALLVSGGMLPSATVIPLGEWLILSSHTKLYLALGPALSIVCWYFGGKAGASEPSVKRGGKRWGTYRDLFSSRTFLILSLTGFIIALVDAVTVSVSLLTAANGLVASYFLASASVTAVIVRVAGAKLMNWLPRAILLAPCGILLSVALFVMSLSPSNFSLFWGGIFYGAGIGAGWPMLHALLSDTLPAHLRPKGTATVLILYDAGWFITPLIVGYVSPLLGIARTFQTVTLFTFIALTAIQAAYWIPFHRAKAGGTAKP
jgi:MFS family permease